VTRPGVVLLLGFALVAPLVVSAHSSPASSVHVSYPHLKPGQWQTITVQAVDLKGRPLAGAAVSAYLLYHSGSRTYRLPRTGRHGRSSLTFLPPRKSGSGRVSVFVTVTQGYLRIPLETVFAITSAPIPNAARPTATATPHPTSTANSALVVVAAVVPSSVVAPQPAWVVVYAHSRSGTGRANATVTVTALFREGAVHATGKTDSAGVAAVPIQTSSVSTGQAVQVNASVRWENQKGSSSTRFQAEAPGPTVVPTAAPVATPTDTVGTLILVPGATSTPTPVLGLTLVPGDTAVPTSEPTSTPAMTSQPTAGSTPTNTSAISTIITVQLPGDTSAVPTSTTAPTPVPSNTTAPAPTPTPTVVTNCPGSQSGCIQAMLDIVNSTRAQYGAPPLTLNLTQTNGTTSCVGSYGHSVAMQNSGQIWHVNSAYPSASFPTDICVAAGIEGENVGELTSGNELRDLQGIHSLMMQEPYTPGCMGNHACNILSSQFHSLGIGIDYVGGSTWLTEDFLS
jgi:uncharacterized protein YkwD